MPNFIVNVTQFNSKHSKLERDFNNKAHGIRLRIIKKNVPNSFTPSTV